MSKKERKKKQKAQPGPWYTKYKGYQFLESVLRDSKKHLVQVGNLLNQIQSIDRTSLLVGEIQELEKVDTEVRGNVPAVVKEYSDISKQLVDFVKEKRPLDETDFKPQVDAAMIFINKLIEDIVTPVMRAQDIIEGAIARKKEKDHVDEPE